MSKWHSMKPSETIRYGLPVKIVKGNGHCSRRNCRISASTSMNPCLRTLSVLKSPKITHSFQFPTPSATFNHWPRATSKDNHTGTRRSIANSAGQTWIRRVLTVKRSIMTERASSKLKTSSVFSISNQEPSSGLETCP